MSLLKVDNLMFNYSDKELFNCVSFQLNQGEHAVLVGQNGCGKTTIFDLITKKLTPDKGTIEWTPGVTYSYLDQHYKVNDDFTVIEFLEQIYKDLFDKEARMNALYEKGTCCLVGYADAGMRMRNSMNIYPVKLRNRGVPEEPISVYADYKHSLIGGDSEPITINEHVYREYMQNDINRDLSGIDITDFNV